MSGKLAYERYQWFHRQIMAVRHPNAGALARKFELSVKQAQRDIEFIRDRLSAPLAYNPVQKGYEYDALGYELPPIWFKEGELLSFCLALRLSATLPDRKIKTSLNSMLERFLDYCFPGSPTRLKDIKDRVSVKNIQYYKIDEAIFHRVVAAVFKRETITISYFSPHGKARTRRPIVPLHLMCYMGSWHLIAYCHMRGEIRDFALSRISDIEASGLEITVPDPLPEIKEYIRRNFGLMSGAGSYEVSLRFSPHVSGWVSEQIWHKAQIIKTLSEGGINLKFPVADLREIRREVLKFGADVEVLYPPELREDIKGEIKKMAKIYR